MKTIEQHQLLEQKDHIVIGLSGGPDSVCLFHVLTRLAPKLELTIHPVHLNHKFRPGAAECDQQYVEELCQKYGLTCRTFVRDCNELAAQTGMTSEEAGRVARYEAFYEVAREVADGLAKEEMENLRSGADAAVQDDAGQLTSAHVCRRVKIAVAQNANDQAETILFRILRGTGTDGLAGIAYKRQEKEFQVIRPLLDVYREDIEAYCESEELDPVIDHTNDEAVYTRNKIRLKLIPYLEEHHNENILESLNRLGRIATADKDYMWQQAEEAYGELLVDAGRAKEGDEIILDRAQLAALHPAIRHRVMMKAFHNIGLTQDISEERLQAADKIIRKKQAPKTVEFPHGYRITVAKGRVFFAAPAE